MRWSQACKYRLHGGKYKGETIEDIGATWDGLAYLIWLRDKKINSGVAEAITTYLDAPQIAAAINEVETEIDEYEVDDPYDT